MPHIHFEKEDKTITCNNGVNLRKLAKKHGIKIYCGMANLLNCRGHGLCGTCEVEIVDAPMLSPRSRMEEVKLKEKPLERRLSCQIRVHGDMTIRTHPAPWVPPPPETPEPEQEPEENG